MSSVTPSLDPPAGPEHRPHAIHPTWHALLVCFVVTAALYANAVPNAFLVDDPAIILRNPAVRDGDYLRILTGPYWPNEILRDVLYRPLTSMSFALNLAISREPWTFRVPNLLMHVGLCAILFALTREVFRRTAAAWIATLLFAFHPIHTEPLNTIVGRADVASTLLMFWALLIWWRDGEAQHGRFAPLAGGLMMLAAVFFKESAVVAIGMMPLLDLYRARGGGVDADWWSRRLKRCYLPLALAVGALLVARYFVIGKLGGSPDVFILDNPIATAPELVPEGGSYFLLRWGTPLVTLAQSASMMFLPWPLRYDYSYPTIPPVLTFSDVRLWYGVAWAVALVLVMVVSWRRRREMFVAVGLAIVSYLIVSNLPIVIGTVFGERLLYAPSVGFCMAVGLLGAGVWRWARGGASANAGLSQRPRQIVVAGFALAVLAAQAVLIVVRNGDWRDWRTLAVSSPADDRASFKVVSGWAELKLEDGYEAYVAGRTQEALALFEESLAFGRQGERLAPFAWMPYSNMGRALYRLGRIDEAAQAFTRAISLSGGGGVAPLMLMDASEVFAMRGRWCEARDALERAVVEVTEWKTLNNLAEFLRRCPRGPEDLVRAAEFARRAIARDAAPCDGHDTLSRVLHDAGDRAGALAAAQEGLARCAAGDPARATLQAWAEELRAAAP